LLSCLPIVIPRAGLDDPACTLAKCLDLDEALALARECTLIVLETSGVDIARLGSYAFGRCVSIVLGAEDYGIPKDVLKNLEKLGALTVRLPMSPYGVSYNVVTSLIILLTELTLEAPHEQPH